MAPVLEALMRRYTGLFSYPVSIEEDYIAAKCGVSVPQLRQLLYQLALEHVIKYIPADNANVIYLHHERLQPGNVQLSPKRYDMLRSTFRGRMQAMLDYAQETEECRSRYLLRYFGQAESADCLCCDVCRARTRTDRDTETALKEFIASRDGRYTLEDLAVRFGAPSAADSDYLTVLRRLVDEGAVPPCMEEN